MRPAIGTRDQLHAHVSLLMDLGKIAQRLEKSLKSGEQIEDPIAKIYEIGLMSRFPFFEVRAERNGQVLTLDDDSIYPITLDYEAPEQSLWEIAQCFKLPGKDEDYHCWHEGIAARAEKARRRFSAEEIIETDGLTCWILALEGMKGRNLSAGKYDEIRLKIAQALRDREPVTEEALEYVRKGFSLHREKSSRETRSTSHWEYEHQPSYSAIAQANIWTDVKYEGRCLKSSLRLNSQATLEWQALTFNLKGIPDSTIMALPGKTLEKVINDDRLHGWGVKATGVQRCNRTKNAKGDLVELQLSTNRGEDETLMSFSVERRANDFQDG